MSKQDRQGVRTPADIERKYNFGEYKKSFDEVRKTQSEVATLNEQLRAELQLYAKKTDLNDYAKASDLDDYVSHEFYDANQGAIDGSIAQIAETCDTLTQQQGDLANRVQDIEDIVQDRGWNPLTIDPLFSVRNNDDSLKPVYKVTGNVVTVCGSVSNVEAMTSTSSGVVFASGIPAEYCPHIDHHFVCQGSGMNRWVCTVKPDGRLYLSRYGIAEQGAIPINTWLPFTVTYQF